jgi:myo-inositol 2-dehydrogenase/D-chiro-inositol 1-dehydrogenase
MLVGNDKISTNIIQIDVGRYFLDVEKGIDNPKRQVNRVLAMGQQAVYSELAKFGDADNGNFWDRYPYFRKGRSLTTRQLGD